MKRNIYDVSQLSFPKYTYKKRKRAGKATTTTSTQ